VSDKVYHGRRTGEGTTITVTGGTGSRPLDVAHMDADAEFDPPVLRHAGVALAGVTELR
jgi:hypothetical protein